MKMVGKIWIGIAGGLILSAAFAFAQDTMRRPMMAGGWEHGRCGERLAAALNLTPDQQAALDAARNETAQTVRPLAEQMRALHGQIEAAAEGASPDACAIGGLVVQGKAIRSQIDAARKAAEAKFVEGLSADQRAAYDNFVAINAGCMAVGAGFMPPPRFETRVE